MSDREISSVLFKALAQFSVDSAMCSPETSCLQMSCVGEHMAGVPNDADSMNLIWDLQWLDGEVTKGAM